MNVDEALVEIREFLPCSTPDAWFAAAQENLPTLLIDHANCEKKAAATAMNLMYRHVANTELLITMSRLAREELMHFQQVVELLARRRIPYLKLGPSRYAAGLRELISTRGSSQLVDILLTGAIVEARSCERFAGLIPILDKELGDFYHSLLKSEARHYRDYLALARRYANTNIQPRLQFFLAREAELVTSEDSIFRFHSGCPVGGLTAANESAPTPLASDR
ncbi:MAG: tRNA-(ms[2]io[6]A)-hydroxylase [Pseudohongiellaceae bacterium]